MHPDVKRLLDLQSIDQEVAALRRDLDSLPREEARRRKRLDELVQTRDEGKAALDKAEVVSRSLETTIQQADEEVRKLEARLNGVRNNAEYQATLLQIESVKRDRDSTQEEGLALLEKLEGQGAALSEAETAAAAEGEVFKQFQEQAVGLREKSGAELEQVMKRREAKTEGIPLDLMENYQTLFGVRGSQAVCAVESRVCQGCFTNITTNDTARLMGGSTIVTCGSCQRILYLPEQ